MTNEKLFVPGNWVSVAKVNMGELLYEGNTFDVFTSTQGRICNTTFREGRFLESLKDVEGNFMYYEDITDDVTHIMKIPYGPEMGMTNKELLDCLYTDMLKIREEQWVPDKDSVDCIIDNVELLASNLGIEVEDSRKDE